VQLAPLGATELAHHVKVAFSALFARMDGPPLG